MTIELSDAEVDFETAVGNPGAYYVDPEAIVADTTLSRAQKLRFLHEWAQDIAQRQVADDEGMAPDDSRSAGTDASRAAATDGSLLRSVNAAIAHAEAEAETDSALTFRTLWRRLGIIAG